ncbi:MAG: cytochrome C oxidase subunit IV family protein [Pseudomonadota bacterium]|nr:cytochrome C oxidase subunit IV family protein [Pseudomonadota bacterium]
MNPPPVRHYLFAWLALLALLAVTCGSAFIPMGRWNTVSNLGVALVKAMIVATIFMGVGRADRLLKVVAALGFVTLTLLIALGATDFLARGF